MVIYLIRHGETDWNAEKRIQGREDIPLNAAGVRQAETCAAALAAAGAGAVLTSPLRRAAETAEILARALGGVPVIPEPGLIEREFGSWSGKIFRDIYNPDVPAVGAEPLDAVGARMLEVLERRAAEGRYQALAAVSHGGAINAALRALSGGAFGSGVTRLKNACISVLRGGTDGLRVEAYNLSPEEFADRA